MTSQKKKKNTLPKALVIVAHPDDETIFFGGAILSLRYAWDVVCLTDGDADGKGQKRAEDFKLACKRLGAKKAHILGFKDRFESRLDIDSVESQLNEFVKANGPYKVMFTHGPLGEYGHN